MRWNSGVNLSAILQIIKDYKELKTVCYRQLIDSYHYEALGVLCLFTVYLDDQDLIRIQKGEEHIRSFYLKRTKVILP